MMNEPLTESTLKGKVVVTADGIELGEVEAEAGTHLRLRSTGGDAPSSQLWLPKAMIEESDGDVIRLNRQRADLHDAVLSLSPGQQREFASLGLNLHMGRLRGLA